MKRLRVPVIDLSKPNAELRGAWRDALGCFGFCAIINHELDSAALSSLSSAFFAQPLAHKMKAQRAEHYGRGGFTPMGRESVAKTFDESADSFDPVESLYWLRHDGDAIQKHDVDEALNEAASRYWEHAEKVVRRLMRLSALSLDWPVTFFDDSFQVPECALRVAKYDPHLEREILYGPHTDYTGFTLLKAQPVAGLQVLLDDEWNEVECPPDALVVNSGDLIEKWTQGRFKSAIHRVVNAHVDERMSIVFFSGPHNDTVVAGVKAGDWLRAKIAQSSTNK